MSPRVLLVSNLDAPFVSHDRRILEELGDVRHLLYRGRSQFPQLLMAMLRADLVVCWFVLGYATTAVLVGRVLGKPVVLIPGGWDVRRVPELGYGAMTTPSRIRKTRFALRHAALSLAVSEDIASAAEDWMGRRPAVLYLGVDTDRYRPEGPRDGSILTLASANNEVDVLRKGLRDFVRVAELLPDRIFVLAGRLSSSVEASLRRVAPGNVVFTGRLDDERLLEAFRRASVYVQVSAHEGFGMALAEAMACGCTPVVTRRGAIPEVVGSCGYYAEYGDLDSIHRAIRDATVRPVGEDARKRIVEHFDIRRRRHGLHQHLSRFLPEAPRE